MTEQNSPKKNQKTAKIIEISPTDLQIFPNQNPFSLHSEEIAKSIIEKIFSYVFTKIEINQIESKIPERCFSFTKKFINSCLTSQYITYDRDEQKKEEEPAFNLEDAVNNSQNQSISSVREHNQSQQEKSIQGGISKDIDLSTYFYNNYYHGENNWDIIDEPKSIKVDRYASSMISYNKQENPNETGENSKKDKLDKIKEEEGNATIQTEENDKGAIKGKSKQNEFIESKPKNAKDKDKKNKKKITILEIMNQMSYYDLPEEDIKNITQDKELIEKLRKEKEDQLKLIESENKVKVQKEKETEKKINEDVNKFKGYERKKITVDANGNVIVIKGIKLEELAKEFLMLKTQSKMVKENKKAPPEKKKEIEIIRNVVLSDRERVERERERQREREREKEREEPQNLPPPNVKGGQPKNKLNFPKIDGVGAISKGLVQEKIEEQIKESIQPSILSHLERKIERGPIIPSGSCFDKFNPEIGVNFIEDKKYKTGGKDFFKKYNKYSLESYNKKLKDTLSSNLLNNFTTTNSLLNNTDYNFQKTFTDSNTINNLTGYTKKNNTKSPMLTTHQFPHFHKQRAFNPLIQLTNSTHYSLSNAFENLDKEKDNTMEVVNRKDIFKEKAILTEADGFQTDRNKNMNLEEMNNFTQTLLSDNWGLKKKSSKPKFNMGKSHFKPQMKQIEKELGKTMLSNTKQLPRVRGRINLGNN